MSNGIHVLIFTPSQLDTQKKSSCSVTIWKDSDWTILGHMSSPGPFTQVGQESKKAPIKTQVEERGWRHPLGE